MRVRNAHTAPVGDLSPGAIGDVNPEHPGIRVALRAGLLVEQVLREDPPVAQPDPAPVVVDVVEEPVAAVEPDPAPALEDTAPRRRARR